MLYTFVDMCFFSYLKETVAQELFFYSARNWFRALQKSAFAKVNKQVCELCQWMSMQEK